MDPVRIYSEAHGRLIDLALGLPPGELSAAVPACPAWTVRQTYAHLAGVCVDVAAGTVTPPVTDQVTAGQVADRDGRDIAEICQEWRTSAPVLLDLMRSQGKARYRLPAVDVWNHENDIRGALGLAAQTEHAEALLDFSLTGMGRSWPQERPALTVTATDAERSWTLGEGTGPHWRGTAFELYRALMGRRTTGQIIAMDWSGDPAPVVGFLSLLPAAEKPLDV
ncbi:maleylpyruvate isomerase family mycothiol-dependent enzyme [Nocardiopsis sp. LOL_012]|uniref:maleylpyruvate isomerase family mycothiol-dependent enzyme n=1 Tax=Nocardiopsis sp. LOL_012 TaxID=3345409 RepID=UPI003A8745FC